MEKKMNYEDIITFLEIYKTNTMSKAADNLFISQGTVSSRINKLEDELSIKLFIRKPGVRSLSLSPDGKLFLPYAQQLLKTWNDSKMISEHKSFSELHIVASDQINTFLMNQYYKEFIQLNPSVFLTCQTEHATEIHKLIEDQRMDIGISFVLHNFPNVVSAPIYKEPFVFIYNKNSKFSVTHNLNDFSLDNEIYGYWSTEFMLWHREMFPRSTRKKIVCGTAGMMLNFFDTESDWAIVPLTVAQAFCLANEKLNYLRIKENYIERTAYLLKNRNSLLESIDNIRIFESNLKKFIRKNTNLKEI